MASLLKTISAIEWKELGEALEFGTSTCEDEAGFGTSMGADAGDDGSGDVLIGEEGVEGRARASLCADVSFEENGRVSLSKNFMVMA
jgi:hypothetical protein